MCKMFPNISYPVREEEKRDSRSVKRMKKEQGKINCINQLPWIKHCEMHDYWPG